MNTLTIENNLTWMNLGVTKHLTTTGNPYKTELSAKRSKVFIENETARTLKVEGGFAILTGTEMTRDEAIYFQEHYLPYKEANMLRAEGVYLKCRKPWPIEQPVLCFKYRQAIKMLGLLYWQMPYEEAIKKHSFRRLPRKKWEQARVANGLSI